jgi:hypothetical protein
VTRDGLLSISNAGSGTAGVVALVDAVSAFILSSASASPDLLLSMGFVAAEVDVVPVVLVAVATDDVLASSCIVSPLLLDLPFFAYDSTALATYARTHSINTQRRHNAIASMPWSWRRLPLPSTAAGRRTATGERST